MARAQTALLLTLACLLLQCWSAMAASCTIRPPPVVITANSTLPFQPLLVNELHGKMGANAAKLIVPAGQASPPHRHPGKEEYMYVTKGAGKLTVWLPGQAARTTYAIKAGDMHYLPRGGIHQLHNTQGSDLEFITVMTPGPIALEPFQDWPERVDVPVRAVVNVMATLKACPPGYEPRSPKRSPRKAGPAHHDDCDDHKGYQG